MGKNEFTASFDLPNCFSEEGCLCAERENMPVLKKSHKITFLLHASSMCMAASSLTFLTEFARCSPFFAACPEELGPSIAFVVMSLILTNPSLVFSTDDFNNSILSLTKTTLSVLPRSTNQRKISSRQYTWTNDSTSSSYKSTFCSSEFHITINKMHLKNLKMGQPIIPNLHIFFLITCLLDIVQIV